MERITGKLDLYGIKFFPMPETYITIKCPKCRTERKIKMVDQIEYPADEEQQVAIDCEGCGSEVERKIEIISVVVTLHVHDSVLA